MTITKICNCLINLLWKKEHHRGLDSTLVYDEHHTNRFVRWRNWCTERAIRLSHGKHEFYQHARSIKYCEVVALTNQVDELRIRSHPYGEKLLLKGKSVTNIEFTYVTSITLCSSVYGVNLSQFLLKLYSRDDVMLRHIGSALWKRSQDSDGS